MPEIPTNLGVINGGVAWNAYTRGLGEGGTLGGFNAMLIAGVYKGREKDELGEGKRGKGGLLSNLTDIV